MNKSGAILVFVFSLLVLSGFAFAANCTSFTYSNWSSCSSGSQTRTILNSTPSGCTGGNSVLTQNCTTTATNATTTIAANLSKIDKGFACLTTQVKSDCSGATTIQEIALTIMASPSTVTQACYDRLLTYKKTEGCFGTSSCSVRDTALAILAINHVGQNTEQYESWLMNQSMNADDLVWYLEQDSNVKSGCKVSYNSADYTFNALENKKLEGSTGNCLTPAQSDYWLQISPNCYDTTFTLLCDADFIATLIYKQPNSPTIYVLSGTKTAQANQPIDLSVTSLCFGINECDYESTAWAAVALDKTGNDIDAYIPYLIANEGSNQRYLPDAFLQILKDFSEYGTKLIQQQQLNSWEAPGSQYGKYYDTSLALIALSNSNQQQVINAKTWLTNSAPGQDGCWNNDNIRDTAIALWALAGRTATISAGGTTSSIPMCLDSGNFCIPTTSCPSGDVLSNYYCPSLGNKCCKTANLQTCSNMSGIVCASNKRCAGIAKQASDANSCCIGECEDIPTETECELADNSCRTSCSSTQTETTDSCGDDSSLVCCKAKPQEPGSSGSTWWIWLLAILIILVILGIIFRDRLKVFIYKTKSKFGEDNNKPSSGGVPPGFGPYSSDRQMPPQQRPMMRPMPIPQQRPMPPMANRPPMRR